MKWCAAILICWSFAACKTPVLSQTKTTASKEQHTNIKSIKLYRNGDQTSFPVLQLGSADGLELHFDDLDASVKNYYYNFQLCNADWTPSMLSTFEYTKGFQNVRISNYRVSSITDSRYI